MAKFLQSFYQSLVDGGSEDDSESIRVEQQFKRAECLGLQVVCK